MGSGILPENIVGEHNPPCHSPLPAKNSIGQKEAISKHDPEAQAFSLGQGSFKMDCGKVENCSVVRRIKIWSSFWKNWDAMSSGLKRTRTTQVVISAQFRSLHLWWYGLHECVWHGQLTHLERHHQCWKVYPSSRTTYTPIQTSSLSGKTLHFPTWQCQTTYCINYNIMAA